MSSSKNHPLVSHCSPQRGIPGLGQGAWRHLAQAPCEQVAQLVSMLQPSAWDLWWVVVGAFPGALEGMRGTVGTPPESPTVLQGVFTEPSPWAWKGFVYCLHCVLIACDTPALSLELSL